MRVSAIIVNWNGGELLDNCVNSLYGDLGTLLLEIIVIDNASTDLSLDRVLSKFPKIKIVRNAENVGFAKAGNQGIRLSHGEYVLLINNDAAVYPGAIGSLVQIMERDHRVGIVGPRLRNPDGTVQYSYGRFPSVFRFLTELGVPKSERYYQRSGYECVHEVDWLTGACLLLRRSMLDDIGLLDERFFFNYEDVDLCRRAQAHGWLRVYVPDADVFHHKGRSSLQPEIRERILLEKRRSQLFYYRKHGNIGSFYLIKALNLTYSLLHILGAECSRMAGYPSHYRGYKQGLYRRLFAAVWEVGWLR